MEVWMAHAVVMLVLLVIFYMATGRIPRNFYLWPIAMAFHACFTYLTSFWWLLSARPPAGSPHGWSPCALPQWGRCSSWMPQLNDMHWGQNPLLPIHAMGTALWHMRGHHALNEYTMYFIYDKAKWRGQSSPAAAGRFPQEHAILCIHKVGKHHAAQVYKACRYSTDAFFMHTHDFAGPVSQNMHQASTGHLCTCTCMYVCVCV